MLTPKPAEGRQLIDELLHQGFQARQLHVYAKDIPGDLPVEATHWRNGFLAFLPGGIVGAAALPTLWQLRFPTPSQSLVLVLALLGAAVCGGWTLAHERRKPSPINARQSAMRRGEMMIAAEVEDGRVVEVERRIAGAQPGVAMLGPDPMGSQWRV